MPVERGRARRSVYGIGLMGGWLLAASPAWAAAARPPDPLGMLTLLLLVPLALAAFTALELMLWVLTPGPLAATCGAIERGRGRCLVTGLGAIVLTVALLSLFNQHPGTGKGAGPLLVGIDALGCLAGVTSVVALLGQAVLDLAGRSGSRALAVIAGSLLLGFAILFPVVGQVLGIYLLLVGLGGAIRALARSFFKRK